MTSREQNREKSREGESRRTTIPFPVQTCVKPSAERTDWSESLVAPDVCPGGDANVRGLQSGYAIPADQQAVFAALMSKIRSIRTVRPLIISDVNKPTGLTDVYDAATPLAAKFANSAAENRSNALRFIDVLARHKNNRGLEAIALRTAMLSCYPTLEKIVDSKALQLKPSSGIDADEVIASSISRVPIYAGLVAVSLGTAFISSAFHTLGWLGLAGLAVDGLTCIFRRKVLSIVRGGVAELKYTNAILKLRAFMDGKA